MEKLTGIHNLDFKYDELEIFRDFTIEFAENKINCILGPSGCGKTTLLNIISGLITPKNILRNDFANKRISYVFQETRLLPWLSVEDNIAFVLKDKMTESEVIKTTNEYLEMVQLENFRHFYPEQLSGGMKQRVSLARAFSYPSDLILMDEPFKGLDIKLKKELSDAFQLLWNHRKVTVIWISHDVKEALIPGRKSYIFSKSPVSILKILDATETNLKDLGKEIEETLNS